MMRLFAAFVLAGGIGVGLWKSAPHPVVPASARCSTHLYQTRSLPATDGVVYFSIRVCGTIESHHFGEIATG